MHTHRLSDQQSPQQAPTTQLLCPSLCLCVQLQAGGNDYVTKPFGQKELVARIQVQLRTKQFSQGVQQPGGGEPGADQLSPAPSSMAAPMAAANGVAAAAVPAAAAGAAPQSAAPAAQQQQQQQVDLLQRQLLAAQQQLAALAAANGPAAGSGSLDSASDASRSRQEGGEQMILGQDAS